MIRQFDIGVKAIIKIDDTFLLLKKEDFWDTPGGRVDDNESLEETLRRELAEELPGIVVKNIGRVLHATRLDGLLFGDHGLCLIWFAVEADFPQGVQLSNEHESYRWCNIGEVHEIGSEGIVKAVEAACMVDSK